MLSTVGYGDYYPITDIERVAAVIIMMACVAIFSFIMSSFMEIIKNYQKKMGTPDIQEPLNKWFISLERFKKGTPVSGSLIHDMTQDINYFNQNDKIGFLKHDIKFS